MKPSVHERRKEHFSDEELQGLAARSLREGVPVDELEIREADVERVNELRAGAKKKLLAMAGYTSEKAAAELQPVLESKGTTKELSTEEVEKAWLGEFKARFDAIPLLHKGIQWIDVEKSLKADPESMAKLQALDAKGHEMNVFGEGNGEFIFASAWDSYEKVSMDHRSIVFDKEAQELLEREHPDEKCNGNATDMVKALGVDLADPNLNQRLVKEVLVIGWAWFKTDAATRKSGKAFYGNKFEIDKRPADNEHINGSFRAELRVKKV